MRHGRAGTPFAIDAAGVVPDLITTAKGLAGGFPAGAVIAKAELADALPKGALGSTFGGGPMACVCIRTVVEALSRPGFLANVRAPRRAPTADLSRRPGGRNPGTWLAARSAL